MAPTRRDLPLTFAALGATGALFGPALPALARGAQVTPARASLAVSALFAGLLVGVGVLALLRVDAQRWVVGLRRSGAGMQAVGLVLVPLSPSLPLLLAAAGLVGVGFGIGEATASAVVVSRVDGAGRLSGLGAVFAVAAVVTPAAVAASQWVSGGVWPAFALVAGAHTLAAWSTRATPVPQLPLAARAAGPGAAVRTGAWAISGLLVLYVGAEVLLSTWATELARDLLAVDASTAALAATAFWICLALGRWAGAVAAHRRATEPLLRGLLWGAAALLAVGAALTRLSPVAALTALAGAVVLLGPAYALALAVGGGPGAGASIRAAAFRIGTGAVGGSVVPLIAAPVAVRAEGVFLVAAGLLAGAGVLAGFARRPARGRGDRTLPRTGTAA